MGLEILRFSQNDKLNDTLFISAVVVLRYGSLMYGARDSSLLSE